jgi:Skp family chaperone for outer membrane proteins
MNKSSYWTGFLSGTTVLALGMVVMLAGSGFQGASLKIGNVNEEKVMIAIDTTKGFSEASKNAYTERSNILAFLEANRLLKEEDINTFKALSLKPIKTDAEKASLEKIKTTAAEAKKKFEDLQFKPTPTDAELKMLDDFRNRQAKSAEIGSKLVNEFQAEIAQIQKDNQKAMIDAYNAAVADVGKKQGYSIIMSANAAPYSANDATEEVAKAATKK